MSKIQQCMAASLLALVGLLSGDYESRAAELVPIVPAAEMRKTLRDLWVGHIFMIQHAVLYNLTYDMAERDAADKQVLANVREIANTFIPYYGEARCEKLYGLLASHYSAVKEYSEATIAGNKPQQDAALAGLASNADLFAEFLNGVTPYLSKDTVRGLIAAHGSHHVLQINLYKKKDYAQLEAIWPLMRQHVYLIADTITMALVKQFPDKFS